MPKFFMFFGEVDQPPQPCKICKGLTHGNEVNIAALISGTSLAVGDLVPASYSSRSKPSNKQASRKSCVWFSSLPNQKSTPQSVTSIIVWQKINHSLAKPIQF